MYRYRMLTLLAVPHRCAVLRTPRRLQSQGSAGASSLAWQDGQLDPRYSSEGSMRKLNPDTMAHYVRATIQNDRREMGLGEIYDWHEFAKDAIYIPTRSGPLWVGSDDPRAAKFVRRRAKMKVNPLQRARKKPGPDRAKQLENHPLREYFTTATTLSDPLSVAQNLHRAGMIREYDIKHTAAKISYQPRPPIVSIMGHVDHGKTTLLDYLRHTHVAASEAGGITQSIGAFTVAVPQSESPPASTPPSTCTITFIDTPGHAAFTAMRAAGASANDLIVLVVSAVDGVQPQTREVIDLAHEHHLPLVVAVTKIDRRPVSPELRRALTDAGLALEEDGGDVPVVGVCGKDGRGVPALLEAILLQAELAEISTPHPSRAELTVLESRVHTVGPRRGYGGAVVEQNSVASGSATGTEIAAVVRCGSVRVGQVFVSGLCWGTVRRVYGADATPLTQPAGPSTPVLLHGFRVPPKPGSVLLQVSSESHAEKFYHFMREVYHVEGNRESFLQLSLAEARGQPYQRKPDHNQVRCFATQPLVLICRAATFGMLQAMMKMIYALPRLDGVNLDVRVTEVGGMRNSDVVVCGGVGQRGCVLIYGDCRDAVTLDVPNHVHVIRCDVLYHGLEELKRVMVTALPVRRRCQVTGVAECLQVFRASQAGRGGNAAGMKVVQGVLELAHLHYRVRRQRRGARSTPAVSRESAIASASKNEEDMEEGMETVYDGAMKELRRFKDMVPSVDAGLECGVIMQDEFAFRVGDRLEAYEMVEESRDVEEEFAAAEERERIARSVAESQAALEAKQQKEQEGGGEARTEVGEELRKSLEGVTG